MASEHNIHRPETHIQQYKNIVRREAFVSDYGADVEDKPHVKATVAIVCKP